VAPDNQPGTSTRKASRAWKNVNHCAVSQTITTSARCYHNRVSAGDVGCHKRALLLPSAVPNSLKAVLLSGDLRKWALLFIFIEVPHRNHTYDVPILIQNDQIWQIAFAHDFSDLIHSLSLEAVALPYLHYTVDKLVLAEIRGETASAGVGLNCRYCASSSDSYPPCP
jgi:hypothetical protein